LFSLFERIYFQSVIYVFQDYVHIFLHFFCHLATVSNFEARLMIHNKSFCFAAAKRF